jgi:hypothetical protein
LSLWCNFIEVCSAISFSEVSISEDVINLNSSFLKTNTAAR